MALTVRVQDFQSIVDVTVVIDGFTVVTGANNSGKTALQRAIQGVFTNPPAGALVRHGAKYLSVTITFPSGDVVTWEKGEKVNRYIVNGKKIEGLGRGGVPDEVKALGVYDIKAGSDRIWPQIAPQFTGQVFLLDRPGSMLAEAVADVEKVGQLSAALKLSERDRRSAVSDLKVRRQDEKDLQAELDGFAGLDDADAKVSSVESSLAEAQGISIKATALVKLREDITQAQEVVDHLKGIEEVSLPDQGMLDEASQCKTDLGDLQGLRDKLNRLRPALAQWEKVVEAAKDVTLGDNAAVEKVQKALGFFVNMRDKLDAARSEVETLEGQRDEQQGYLDAQELVVEEVLLEMGACPVCHQRIGEAHEHADGVGKP